VDVCVYVTVIFREALVLTMFLLHVRGYKVASLWEQASQDYQKNGMV